ncbi:MAG: ABC transporter ATP-binding protein [Anaerovoracaceae bacterium]|jgi:ATP-binding cassette subfamily B multidrug efflux pump
MAENRRKSGVAPHGGPGSLGAPGEKAKNFRGAVKQLFAYMGRLRFVVVLVMAFAGISTVFYVIGPKVLGHATTELAEGLMRKINSTGGIDFERILDILLFALILYAVSSLFSFLEGWLMNEVTQKVCYRMRRDISEKINRMPIRYFESRTYGEVLSRITNDVDTLGQGLNQSVSMLITSLTTIVGVLVMMLSISPLMTLIAVVVLPVSAVLLSLLVRVSQKYFRRQQDYLGRINGQVEENFAGQQIIKAFGREKKTIDAFEETNETLCDSAWKSQFLSGIMMPVMAFVGNLGYAGVAIAGGFLAINGVIGIGDIQAFIQYVKNLTQPLQQIAQVMNQLQSMAASAERVFEFLAEEEEKAEDRETVRLERVEGAVRFSHVRFGYDPAQPIIRDFSTDVQPGQKIAIVGPTGAGKTTLVKLLMRFYDVDAGSISVDGHDLRDFERRQLRQHIGMVLQDTWLFSGTIRENIRFGRLDASDDEVEAAARAAHADHFIRTLPDGYDMILNEDATNVSQGQKQLLTIARAILADRRLLILDEATSSVDTRTEELIQDAMDRLMAGRTSFVIAHRLSTIRNADRILVLRHGDIVEQGTHDELLQRGGFYAELYQSQFEDIEKAAL